MKETKEVEISSFRAKEVSWICEEEKLADNQFAKEDKVVIVEDFTFSYERLFFAQVKEIIKVPKGTIGFVKRSWYFDSYHYIDIVTTDGIRLNAIPCYFVEFIEDYERDTSVNKEN